ncbi:MAG: aminopeptidase P family protein [Cyanobacteria bacterium SBLK]|nr:aminopeptidase P family protein [Cyanobacteria bacterium SBLK]
MLASTLRQRRHNLKQKIDFPAILWSGGARSRNFPNTYPFRASSHFLYFAGLPLENAAIRLDDGKLELYWDEPPEESTLWHGEQSDRDEIAAQIGADAAYPLPELSDRPRDAATIAVQDATTYQQQINTLNRSLSSPHESEGRDLTLIKAIICLRLTHDRHALSELQKAANVSVEAHQAGMRKAKIAKTEAEVRGAMESAIIANNMTCSYNSIVTVRGEVLHNERYDNPVEAGDLILADVGAETPLGWAADITRTFPATGKFSPTQRDIYDVVLAAQKRCIDRVKPGVEYRDIHLLAALTIAEGLVDLGILRGTPSELVDRDAHALFFPHGIGHLLGLDVHDMEDLGDLAGYEAGRQRSDRFGLGYLRLDRTLRSQMLVTIEPGFYQVPALLQRAQKQDKYKKIVNWERLAKFADTRGIRIEDDVLVTESGCEILTEKLPKVAEHIEELVMGNG